MDLTGNDTTMPGTKREAVLQLLQTVSDPEIPVLSIIDLGIVRNIQFKNSDAGEEIVEVTITSTYTGCPAMDMIAAEIHLTLAAAGHKHVKISQALSPAWTTEWMTEAGKEKLKAYGIAAPNKRFDIPADGVECPRCNSHHTILVSEFGSTACKALYRCDDCKEPFDYFKCH